MSIKEQFYNRRPLALFDPRGALRLDPRYTFTRGSSATFVDSSGIIRTAAANAPRLTYDPATGDSLGLLLEQQSVNEIIYSYQPITGNWALTNQTYEEGIGSAPDGTNNRWRANLSEGLADKRTRGPTIFGQSEGGFYTFSAFVHKTGTQISNDIIFINLQAVIPTIVGCLSGQFNVKTGVFLTPVSSNPLVTDTSQAVTDRGEYWRISVTGNYPSGFSVFQPQLHLGAFGNTTATGKLEGWLMQVERKPYATSPILTTTTPVARAADLLTLDNQDIPTTGSIYIDARAIAASENETILSIANDIDEQLTLSIKKLPELFNSPALIYEIQETFTPTLPFPTPTTGDQRNVITFGETNTHYQVGFSRQTPTLASAVPEGLNRLGIGHNVTDPTTGFNGTISRLYLWPGEIPPEIGRGLVRGDFQMIDAASPNVIIPDSHTLVFNTQGPSLGGSREITFRLFGNNNNVTIDWGDGTSEIYSGSSANAIISHTYTVAGLYLVQIIGPFENISLGKFANSQGDNLVAVPQNSSEWTPTDLTGLYEAAITLTDSIFDNFPSTANVTSFFGAFDGLRLITSIPTFETSSVTTFREAWRNCTALASFPLIDTSACTVFQATWNNCRSLTSFPAIDTSSGNNFFFAWDGCASLTTFPLIDTSKATNLFSTWGNCESLTTFPLVNTSAVTSMQMTWANNRSLVSFPEIDTSSTTFFFATWSSCISLVTFPLLDTSSGITFQNTWSSCESLTDFPLIDTSSGTNFTATWDRCSSLESFPEINTSSGTRFNFTWQLCTSLTSFPQLDFSSAANLAASQERTGLYRTWFGCSALTDYPANQFDNVTATDFDEAFTNCALTPQSIENILVSINTANTSNGNLGLSGGTNAVKTSWTANANTAYDALVARGWTITFRP
jgi:hypothetical protein